jgi:hypothetical protein
MLSKIVGKKSISRILESRSSLLYLVFLFFVIQRVSIFACSIIERLYEHFDKANKIGLKHDKVTQLAKYLKSFVASEDSQSQTSDTMSQDKKPDSILATGSNLTYFHNNLPAKVRCMSNLDVRRSNSFNGSSNNSPLSPKERKKLERSIKMRRQKKENIYKRNLQTVRESETEQIESDCFV